MDQFLTGHDKIQKICDTIRKEALEPAQNEASNIIENAKNQAAALLNETEKKIEAMIAQAQKEIEKERLVFQSSLDQAVQLSLELLKQEVFKIFNSELFELIKEKTSEVSVISRIIEVIIEAVKNQGIQTDIEVLIPKHVSTEEVIAEVSQKMQNELSKNNIKIGTFQGGAQVKLIDKKMSIDLTAESLHELLSNYVRKDFRKFVFTK